MEEEEKTIKILADTIDRLNRTIETQNRLIEDLRKRLETVQNEYSPSIMTVGVLIGKLNNTKTRSGKACNSFKKESIRFVYYKIS